jgi:hypothetical protein
MGDSGHSRVEKDGNLVEKYYWGEGRGKVRNDIKTKYKTTVVHEYGSRMQRKWKGRGEVMH